MFQVLTGESWSEAIARTVIMSEMPVMGSLFWVSFIIVTQIVLVNVVVAVLLDKMAQVPEGGAEEDKDAPAETPKPVESPAEGQPDVKKELTELRGMIKKMQTDISLLVANSQLKVTPNSKFEA